MKCVLLDRKSLDIGDMDFSALESVVSEYVSYDETSPGEVMVRCHDAGVVISNKVVLGEEILGQLPSLKLVCVAATGTNNVDIEAAYKNGITVCNVRAYATPSVVEHVFSLLLSLSRRLHQYHHAAIDGHWMASKQFCVLDYPMSELRGKKLGIVGFGELGQAVAKVAEAFGMNVQVSQRPGTTEMKRGRIPLAQLLQEVDVVSLHCPLDENTRNLIGAEQLALMKTTAILINTARGGIVDEQALADALREGKLGGAGVDVLHEEPPEHGNILLDPDIPNLIVTPHVAWASRESRQRLVDEVVENIRSFVGGVPRNVV